MLVERVTSVLEHVSFVSEAIVALNLKTKLVMNAIETLHANNAISDTKMRQKFVIK